MVGVLCCECDMVNGSDEAVEMLMVEFLMVVVVQAV
jgi:hypothetical protein